VAMAEQVAAAAAGIAIPGCFQFAAHRSLVSPLAIAEGAVNASLIMLVVAFVPLLLWAWLLPVVRKPQWATFATVVTVAALASFATTIAPTVAGVLFGVLASSGGQCVHRQGGPLLLLEHPHAGARLGCPAGSRLPLVDWPDGPDLHDFRRGRREGLTPPTRRRLRRGGSPPMARTFGRLGIVCLGIYLLLQGLVHVIGLGFAGLGVLMGVLAILAGVLLLVGK
jgi:hypothetical protein